MQFDDLVFPKDFFWGAATSGPQSESRANRSMHVMDKFYEIARDRFYKEQYVVNDLENNLEEYVELARVLNFNSLRTSIQWTRLIPDGKNVSPAGVAFYRQYFSMLRERGVMPMVVLNHFDLPLFVQDEGGWENKKTIDRFVSYAEIAFREFGDLVHTWFTFNEPMVVVHGGYLYNFQYPNKLDMRAAMQVQFNMLIAHLKVVNLFKGLRRSGEIGIILNISPVIPRSNHPGDVKAAEWADLFHTRCFLDPILKHEYPSELLREARKRGYMWDITNEEERLISTARSMDLLGVNYYSPLRVKVLDHTPNWEGAITPKFYYDEYVMPGRKMNESRGWEIYAPGLYAALKRIQLEYDNIKVIITENGIGVDNEDERRNEAGIIVDDYRIDFIKEHLTYAHQAISEGARCVGYHVWTYVDNWSWINGYKNRYGLFELDLATTDIYPKKSAAWMRRFLAQQRGLIKRPAVAVAPVAPAAISPQPQETPRIAKTPVRPASLATPPRPANLPKAGAKRPALVNPPSLFYRTGSVDQFLPAAVIDEKVWQAVLDAVYWSPTSHGYEAYRVLIIDGVNPNNYALIAQLDQLSLGGKSFVGASKLMLFISLPRKVFASEAWVAQRAKRKLMELTNKRDVELEKAVAKEVQIIVHGQFANTELHGDEWAMKQAHIGAAFAVAAASLADLGFMRLDFLSRKATEAMLMAQDLISPGERVATMVAFGAPKLARGKMGAACVRLSAEWEAV